MRLTIEHRTLYRYDQPISYAIQSLRMTPRRYDGQGIEHWSVTVAGRRQPLTAYLDGYGNWVQLHTRNAHHESTEIIVTGVVEVTDRNGIVAGADEPLPPVFYLRETPLTEPDTALTDLSHQSDGASGPVEQMHRLMAAILDRVAYRVDESDTETTAAAALAAGKGVCQDHAHVMIACARTLGYPARYVSGYLYAGESDAPYEAAHAWAEVHVPDLGWVGFDPSNGVSPTEQYVRGAIGLDYWSAAPIRGLWRGQAEEDLSVAVKVASAASTR